jgi:hypothetical protein
MEKNTCILEIKCPISCKDSEINVDYIDSDGKLKTNHAYYTQIQILLYVTCAKTCHFFVFSSCDYKLIIVHYDANYL